MIGCYLFASTSQGGYAGDTTITAQYSFDGGTLTSFVGAVVHIGGGSYWQPFSAGEQVIINSAGECIIAATSTVDDPEPVTIRPVIIRSVPNYSTVQMTENYAAVGVVPTPQQALLAIQQMLLTMQVDGATLSFKKINGTDTAMTFTKAQAVDVADGLSRVS